MKTIIFSLFFISFISAFAHEGHNDASPKSQHGGVVKSSKNFYAEVVQEGDKWNIYLTDHFYKPENNPSLQMKAEIKSKKTSKKIDLIRNKDFWQFRSDLANEKFFKLVLKIQKNNKVEDITFNLEPMTN